MHSRLLTSSMGHHTELNGSTNFWFVDHLITECMYSLSVCVMNQKSYILNSKYRVADCQYSV